MGNGREGKCYFFIFEQEESEKNTYLETCPNLF